jgi:hypothetical protein
MSSVVLLMDRNTNCRGVTWPSEPEPGYSTVQYRNNAVQCSTAHYSTAHCSTVQPTTLQCSRKAAFLHYMQHLITAQNAARLPSIAFTLADIIVDLRITGGADLGRWYWARLLLLLLLL